MEELNIRMLGDRILLIKSKPPQESTILDVKPAEGSPVYGTVIKIGESVSTVAVDDNIMFKQEHTTPIKLDNQEYLIIREYDVIAVI